MQKAIEKREEENKMQESEITTIYNEYYQDVSGWQTKLVWVKKKVKIRSIGFIGGTFSERLNFKIKYPRKCEVCGKEYKNKDTWLYHVVSKHKVTAVAI